jgi:hypothetical protein
VIKLDMTHPSRRRPTPRRSERTAKLPSRERRLSPKATVIRIKTPAGTGQDVVAGQARQGLTRASATCRRSTGPVHRRAGNPRSSAAGTTTVKQLRTAPGRGGEADEARRPAPSHACADLPALAERAKHAVEVGTDRPRGDGFGSRTPLRTR